MIEILDGIDAFVWGPAMIGLLLGTHVFLTFKTGFIQRKLPAAIRMSFKKDPQGEGDISNFGALATALAATIGTGSIVGVATAILAEGQARCSGCGSPACSASPPSTWRCSRR